MGYDFHLINYVSQLGYYYYFNIFIKDRLDLTPMRSLYFVLWSQDGYGVTFNNLEG